MSQMYEVKEKSVGIKNKSRKMEKQKFLNVNSSK